MIQVKLNDLEALDLTNGPGGLKEIFFDSEEEMQYIVCDIWKLTIDGNFIIKQNAEYKNKVGIIMQLEGAE